LRNENCTSIRKRHKRQDTGCSVAFTVWEKILNKLKKYEQALKLRSDLKEAFEQVAILKQTKGHKQTLNEFLNEL